jgi:hypothetical protein
LLGSKMVNFDQCIHAFRSVENTDWHLAAAGEPLRHGRMIPYLGGNQPRHYALKKVGF